MFAAVSWKLRFYQTFLASERYAAIISGMYMNREDLPPYVLSISHFELIVSD